MCRNAGEIEVVPHHPPVDAGWELAQKPEERLVLAEDLRLELSGGTSGLFSFFLIRFRFPIKGIRPRRRVGRSGHRGGVIAATL